MELFKSDALFEQAEALFAQLDALPLGEKVAAINALRQALHRHSPFAGEPVDCVLWVSADQVEANDYNPNKVAPPEMKLLQRSVEQDGYTQPIVAHAEDRGYTVVDGFHRTRVGREVPRIRQRLHGYLPVSVVKEGRADRDSRMAATIRHNRARGVHGVLPMVDIVAELLQRGLSDDQVATELGMDADEVLRLKQNAGLPELFAGREYSRAWE